MTSDPTSSRTVETITSMISGKTVVSNLYTTFTYPADAGQKSQSGHGLSKKNRNIIIGCVVGIGVPLIILALLLIYFFCVQSTKTDFIDSDGKVVTAYRANKVTKWWYAILGKDISDKYESNSPLGNSNSPIMDGEDGQSLNSHNDEGIVDTTTNSGGGLHSNDLMLEEDKFYDEEGNELTARNY